MTLTRSKIIQLIIQFNGAFEWFALIAASLVCGLSFFFQLNGLFHVICYCSKLLLWMYETMECSTPYCFPLFCLFFFFNEITSNIDADDSKRRHQVYSKFSSDYSQILCLSSTTYIHKIYIYFKVIFFLDHYYCCCCCCCSDWSL